MYEPETFQASDSVQRMHEKTWYRGTNEFSLPEENGLSDAYWRSVLLFPVILLGVLLLTLILLCVSPCCLRVCSLEHRGLKKMATVIFVLTILASCANWMGAFTIEDESLKAAESFLNSFSLLDDHVGEWELRLQTLQNSFHELSVKMSKTSQICDDNTTTSLEGFKQRIDNSETALSVLVEVASEIKKGLRDRDLVDASDHQEGGFQFFSIVMVLLLLGFGVTSMVQFYRPQTTKYLNRCFCLGVFTIGVVIAVGAMLISVVTHPIAVVGSDMCLPSIDQTLQHILSISLHIPELAAVDDFGVPLCHAIQGEEVLLSNATVTGEMFSKTLCFYQTCSGGDMAKSHILDNSALLSEKFQQTLKEWVDEGFAEICEGDLHDRLLASLSDIIRLIGSEQLVDDLNNVVATQLAKEREGGCSSSLSALQYEISASTRPATHHAGELLSCKELNPLYQLVFHDLFCNGIISVTVVTSEWLGAGAMLMLISLVMFLYFGLNKSVYEVSEDWLYAHRKPEVPFQATVPLHAMQKM